MLRETIAKLILFMIYIACFHADSAKWMHFAGNADFKLIVPWRSLHFIAPYFDPDPDFKSWVRPEYSKQVSMVVSSNYSGY